jgi:hypothetical protein
MENRIHKLLEKLTNDNLTTKRVYKYHKINKHFYDILINNQIWFSDPYSYNDPFDCNITIDGNNSPKQIKSYFKIANWNNSKDTDETIQRLVNSNFKDKDAFQEKINKISKQVIGKLGLACFTGTKDNLLMWAHYTGEHKGVCLEFDYSKDIEFFKPFKKVNYDKVYPTYNYYNDKNNVVEQLLIHKSEHWSYEEEVRLIKKKTGLYEFKPESLTGIYFGVKTQPEQINTIKNLLKESKNYSQTKTYKGSLNSYDYKIDFKEV